MYFVLLNYCEQPSNVRSLANTGATSSGLQEASSRTSRSIIIIIIIKSTQGRVVAPLRDLVISLDLPVLQLRELINWQVTNLIN
jgi:hypothetical protein